MLKYNGYSITFQEFPGEISLCLNISNCPCKCDGCSEPWLQSDTGIELTYKEIDKLIKEHPDITTVGFLGGDSDHLLMCEFADYIHSKHFKKVGFYSGRDFIDLSVVPHVDMYKIGRWIMPSTNSEEWKDHNWGPINWPVSNQLYFEKKNGKLINSTQKFRMNLLNNWNRYIITNKDEKDLK